MRVLIIDQCSGTKDFPDDLPVADQEWTGRADQNEILSSLDIDGIQARDLYNGKQQQRIGEAVQVLKTNDHDVTRYFLSAGFGAVAADVRLPPYEATFNKMTKDEIEERSNKFGLTERIKTLIENNDYDIVFFALGMKYYDAFDLRGVLSAMPTKTTVVLFNQEEIEDDYENVVSIPARTEQGKKYGSSVIGLKGTYLKYFAAAIGDDEAPILPSEAAEYCLTSPSGGSQSDIDRYS
jgi:hypothetical protein